ncbi:MAG TPA: hypothetical protein VF618_21920 [Thermoanaerobaculia bacterium]
MKKKLLGLSVALLVAALAVPGAFAANDWTVDDTRMASLKVAELGVTGYRIDVQENSTEVELLDESANVTARVSTQATRSFARVITYASSAAEFQLEWDAKTPSLTLVEKDGGRFTLTAGADRSTTATPGAEVAFARREKEIALAVEALGDLAKNGVPLHGRLSRRAKVDESGTFPDGPGGETFEGFETDSWEAPGGSCGGLWVRGTAYGLQGADPATLIRSMLCYQAEQDAHVKCWNSRCIGCCRVLQCDAHCFVGDYFCTMAGVSGQSCK